MRKILLIVLAFFFFLFPQKIYAEDPNFDISINSLYEVKKDGITTLTQNVSITNRTEYNYTPSFSLSVGFNNIENIVAYDSNGSIPFTLDDSDKNNKNIKLRFEKRYAGLGITNNFTIRFESSDIAKKRGSVWEVSTPGISDPSDFSDYNVKIKVPKEFGKAKIIKPSKNNSQIENITFTKDDIGKAGIYLIFGDKQYYKFRLSYNISNPNLFPVKTEIALPPNTNYQKVLVTNFSEKPTNVSIDRDQNWIAEYKLFPQQRETIIVEGFVQVDPNQLEKKDPEKDIEKYLRPQEYWDIDEKTFKELSQKIKTPEEIYNFVTQTLNYNFDKVTGNNKRLGATLVLKTPKNSVCLEFTDLYIALARASGIPARAVEGYAYTDNSNLRPLSLVEDVLHSWPEYYDKDKETWIMIDPTWGNTTKGMDYFGSLDFEHIAFVVKGVDSTYPIPAGGYKFDKKSKDVVVNFATKDDFKEIKKLEFSNTFPDFSFPNFKVEGSFIIENKGNSMTEPTNAVVTIDGNEKKIYQIEGIPPGGRKTITLKSGSSNFLTNKDKTLKIQVGEKSFTKKIKISFIPELKTIAIIGGIILGGTIIAIITYYTGSLLIQRRKGDSSLRG